MLALCEDWALLVICSVERNGLSLLSGQDSQDTGA